MCFQGEPFTISPTFVSWAFAAADSFYHPSACAVRWMPLLGQRVKPFYWRWTISPTGVTKISRICPFATSRGRAIETTDHETAACPEARY